MGGHLILPVAIGEMAFASDVGNETYFYELLTRSCAAGAAPACFSSYEGAWDDALAACRRQPDARPIMLTLLRSPMAWLYSAMR